MKKYKLLKDLPTFKAGQMFVLLAENEKKLCYNKTFDETIYEQPGLHMIDDDGKVGVLACHQTTLDKFPNILRDWFEEVEFNEEYYAIDGYGKVSKYTKVDGVTDDHKSIGNYFKTREEAFDALEKIVVFRRLQEDGLKFDGFTRVGDGEIIIRAMIDKRAEEWNHSQDEDLEYLYRKEGDNE